MSLGFFAGARAVMAGLARLRRDGRLRGLAIAPVLITLVAYVLALSLAVFGVDDLVARVWARPDGGWQYAAWIAVVIVCFVVVAAILVLSFVAFATVISGPFHERIALAVLAGEGVARDDVSFVRGLIIDGSWALTFAIPAVILGLMAFIPVVGPAFGALAVAVAAIGLAGASAGPAVSATGGGYRARWALIGRHRAFVLGAALVLALTVVVPFLGLVIVPGAVIGLTEALARAGALGTAEKVA